MPCDSSYMDATMRERELSRVACLLDEIDGKKIDRNDWAGYHEAVYNKIDSEIDADGMVKRLCSHLRKHGAKKYSLEMQMWWRDHQAADRKRRKRK